MYDGKLNISEMQRQAYTVEDFLFQARNIGIMDLNEIKMAILEPTGELSVFKKSLFENQILPIIISGAFQKYNLQILNIKEEDVITYLHDRLLMLSDISYLSSDGKNFYILESL